MLVRSFLNHLLGVVQCKLPIFTVVSAKVELKNGCNLSKLYIEWSILITRHLQNETFELLTNWKRKYFTKTLRIQALANSLTMFCQG